MPNPIVKAGKEVKAAAGKIGDFFGGVTRYDSKAQAPVGSALDQRQRKVKNTPAMKDDATMGKVSKKNDTVGSPKAAKVARY